MSASSQNIGIWECKHCHHSVKDEESVAFHLIDGFLYGWCRPCFSEAAIKRNQTTIKNTDTLTSK
ncbi:MAG: hypothetical protein IPK14_18650 [Blastocatellia bacterium]|nr:hypothetical protein [Blastocatellia bacterium]MBL8193821.1 hypothetical protein [Blastocatellia bacterium]MBN8724970.1 hypothetical protein [Acidobacteriota bacterium]